MLLHRLSDLQIINGGATHFTRFSRPQYDEAVPAAVRKPMNQGCCSRHSLSITCRITSNLRLKHSAPFVRSLPRSFLSLTVAPSHRETPRLKHELDRSDCVIEGRREMVVEGRVKIKRWRWSNCGCIYTRNINAIWYGRVQWSNYSVIYVFKKHIFLLTPLTVYIYQEF